MLFRWLGLSIGSLTCSRTTISMIGALHVSGDKSINGSNPIDHHTIHPDRHLHSPQIKNQLFKIHFILFLSLSKLRGFEFPRRRKLKCFPLDSQIVFSCFNFMLLLGSKRYELTTIFFTLH
ncbi:hypothetical protein NC651_014462 [Populus alba x Populus x berolinensis]|nr:hypothetical protein NC651_014462 [Populus alba x Populus x berolinensis]